MGLASGGNRRGLLVLLLVIRPGTDPSPGGGGTAGQPKGTGSTESDRDPNERLGAVASSDNSLPDQPADGIASILDSYSGRELSTKLFEAGHHYSRLGIGATKEFILNAPPGSVGKSAITGAVQGINASDAPELFAFLTAREADLGSDVTAKAHRDLIAGWVHDDFESAWAFLLRQEPGEKRNEWLRRSLFGSKAEVILPKIWELEDTSLKTFLLASPASIRAHLDEGRYEFLEEIDDRLNDDAVARSLVSALGETGNTVAAITALRDAKLDNSDLVVEAISNWASRDTNAALTYLGSAGDPALVSSVIERSYREISKFDRTAALEWARRIQDPHRREAVINELNQSG